MSQPDVAAVDWYQAFTLTERMASFEAVHTPLRHIDLHPEHAQRRLARWKSQAPFDRGTYFAQRLATDGINEGELLRLLGEPPEAMRAHCPEPPVWLTDLARAFSRASTAEPLRLPEPVSTFEAAGFLAVIEPLLRQGRERLQQGIEAVMQTSSDAPVDPDTIMELLWGDVPGLLLTMLSRTLVLELNVARLQGLLRGDTPEERFHSFLQRLRQRDVAWGILQEYPVLARQLALSINRRVAFRVEFLQHLCHDWTAIRAQFTPDADPGVLTEVRGTGDSHRHGRSVVIASFRSGLQLVYKPRSMSLDVHFQALLRWINARGEHAAFRTMNILDRETYGWVECIAAQPCSCEEDLQRFYERQGGYLALLYALGATDLHHENLIAAGEHPMLLDLEALFHPRVGGIDCTQADQLANRALHDSVYGTGLLPHRVWANDASAGIDVSGFGATAGQLTPHRVPRWQGVGTDEMKLSRQRVELSGTQNQPTLNGEKVPVLQYVEAITRGFIKLYHLLMQHRDDLLAADGPLAHFAVDTVRVIFRATRTYAMLLAESFHPDVLRNALDRDRLLDRLWSGVEQLPQLARLIPAEREDLLQGDIPIFTTRPATKDLWTSAGQRLTDFLDEPGLAAVQRRLRQLSAADLARQLWIIHAALASLSPNTNGPKRYGTALPRAAYTVADHDRLLAAARAIGERVEILALRGAQDASWIGLTLANERQWSLIPLGTDLYDGLPGVTLFLAYLGAVTQEERYTTLAHAAFKTLQGQLAQGKSSITPIGAFNGWGGIIYTLTHLGTLWHQPELLAQAEGYVELLPPLIERDRHFDIIGGAAGCMGSLLSLYRCRPAASTLAAAVQCGDLLRTHAQPMEQGCGWVVRGAGTRPLAGFAHGNAGIAWALLELAALSGEERFRTTAHEALAYERSLFSPQALNWADLREGSIAGQAGGKESGSFMTAWCHGAPGIGLARLRCLRHLDDAQMRSDIDTALNTTLTQGFGSSHSLCHGDLGNLEILLQASEILGEPQWRLQAYHLAASILESIAQHGWRCGIPLEVESPGLMTGLAGIGFGLLRSAEPARVPSILTLASPILPGDSVKCRK